MSESPPTTEEIIAAVAGKSIADVFAEHGITPEYLAEKLIDELEATETKVFNDKDDGIIYSTELIAWGIRQKARMDAHKLLNHYPAERKEIDIPGKLDFAIKSPEIEEKLEKIYGNNHNETGGEE